MIPIPANVRIWIATGHTDMRRGMTSLALQVQEILKRDPHTGDLYLFRGKRGGRVTFYLLRSETGQTHGVISFIAYSDDCSHRFRSKPATYSDRSQPGIPMIPAG